MSNILYIITKSYGTARFHYILYKALKPRRGILRLLLLCFALTLAQLVVFESVYSCSALTISSTTPYHNAVAARTQTPTSLIPSSITQKFTVYADPADGISIQYPSDWEKIEYFQAPVQMSTAGYKVVVNFLAPIINASDQWREYLMIQVANQSIVKNLVPQMKTTLAGNPAYKLVYTNNEEIFHLKTLEAWTTIGDSTYLFIYKAEATKYSSYLPIIQMMLDSFKVGSSAGLLTNSTTASTLQKSIPPNILTR